MHTAVSPDLHAQLYRLCQSGGLPIDRYAQFTFSKQGRIHDVYRVQSEDAEYVIQRLNPLVVHDSSTLVKLINHVLAPAAITSRLLAWPASKECVLHNDTGHWILRPYIVGKSMTAQLSLNSFKAMARALSHFHRSLSVAEFGRSDFIGVNPWSGDATMAMEKLICQKSIMTSQERNIVDEWARQQKSNATIQDDVQATPVVVHRDPKPSNFIQKPDGSLVLIDFDTIGVGEAVLDLGELLRAWLSSDELGSESESQSVCAPLIQSNHDPGTQCLAVSRIGCTQAIEGLQTGYDSPELTRSHIRRAAMRCCLWQCERFLKDHFAGDLYYSVQTHGDNLIRANQQLEAFQLLSKLSDI